MKKLFLSLPFLLLSAILLSLATPGYDIWGLAYIALIPMIISVHKHGNGFKKWLDFRLCLFRF
jgi:apolipoprotein N-acyltransferase